jgi:hypothetical protein
MVQLMEKTEYIISQYEGKRAKFKLTSGVTLNGMISPFFPDEPETYYYVATGNIQAFKLLMKKKNFSEMKQLCVRINLTNITEVEPL